MTFQWLKFTKSLYTLEITGRLEPANMLAEHQKHGQVGQRRNKGQGRERARRQGETRERRGAEAAGGQEKSKSAGENQKQGSAGVGRAELWRGAEPARLPSTRRAFLHGVFGTNSSWTRPHPLPARAGTRAPTARSSAEDSIPCVND